MGLMRSISRMAARIAQASWRSADSGDFKCADCPIQARCGREPSEICLPRAEAVSAGRRAPGGLRLQSLPYRTN